MNEVYVIAGGEWLRNNLNAIAAFMGTRTWDSIEKIALTLSVLAVAVMWVQRHNVMDLLGWVAVFVLISLLVNVRTSVQVIDNSDLVKVHRVDNVPVGLAMPLSLTTRIGHAMVASYEMIFTQPDSVTYSKTGMLFGAELVSKSTDFLSRNPEITNLFQDYVQNCVMGDIYLNHKYTLEELMASADPYTLIFSRPSPLRGVYDSNNNFVTCKDASVSLKDKLNLDTQSGGKTWHYYAQQLFGGRPDAEAILTNTSSPEIAERRRAMAWSFVQEQVQPGVDNAWRESRGDIGKGMESVPSGGGSQDIIADHQGHQAIIDQRTQDSNIRNDVKHQVDNMVTEYKGNIGDTQNSIHGEENIVDRQYSELKNNHKQEEIQQNNRYNEENKRQKLMPTPSEDALKQMVDDKKERLKGPL
ncbi:conjugal transfer protein TraG N-terminal domain-containing protein [Escherichia coli]|uniref:conjugal transfer protein TraG N-terminal domain-containing protein n=1 Tax=Escherichia coli TaxID=562 RepID=UPI00094093E7|nr:conjugal transfer protein TraG N-terminal domain-containing protein [Escherichia coli]